MAKVSKLVSKALGLKRKLHCAYCLQSSGQVERMNRTLKEILTKLRLETGHGWIELLPVTLLKVRCTPYKRGFTPYEIMFGRTPPLLPRVKYPETLEISNHNLCKSLRALQ